MPRTSCAAALLLAAGAVFARPQPAGAQATTPAVTPPPNVNVSAEFGGRSFMDALQKQQLGKFTEYKDVPSGAVLRSLLVGYATPDSLRTFNLTGYNVGQLDQTLGFEARQAGLFNFQLHWDRILHTFSSTARMLGTRQSPNYFSLAGVTRGDTGAFNRALDAIQPSGYMGPVRTRWDPVKMSLTLMPNEQLDSHIEYTRIAKMGDRPFGMAFGSPGGNAREILEPIDQTLHDVKVSQGFATERYQLLFSYNLSLNQNAYTSVMAENPMQATDNPYGASAVGRTGLAPSNVAHMVSGTGGLALPMHTRVTGTLSYSWWLQDEPFIPMTINGGVSDPRLASLPSSLGGRAGTSVANFTVTSRPLMKLSLAARYRRYDFRDKAAVDTMPIEVVNDQGVAANKKLASGPAVERDPFGRTSVDVSGNYSLFNPISVFAGYGYESMTLSNPERNAAQVSDKTPRVGFVFTGNEWLSFRTTYSKTTRENNGYTNNSGYVGGFQRLDLANRDRERVTVVTTVTPTDQLSFSTTWNVGHDNYPKTVYGVQNDRNAAIGGDIDWSPISRFSAGAGYSREADKNRFTNLYHSGSVPNNPTWVYVADNIDLSTVTSAYANANLIPDKLDVGGTFEMSHSRFHMNAYNPQTPCCVGQLVGAYKITENDIINATASNFPVITQNLQPLDLFARYTMTRDWAATIRYQSEMFSQSDFRLVGDNPGWWNMVFLGNQFQNYNARFLTISLTYHPGPLRGLRSTL